MKSLLLLLACTVSIMTSCTNEKTYEVSPLSRNGASGQNSMTGNNVFTVSPGWNIYDGPAYRYGPSIIINDDGTMDIWFASPGENYIHDNYIHNFDVNTPSYTPLSMGSANVAGQKFSVDQPFYAVLVSCPNWGGQPCNLRLSLYKWFINYTISVAMNPVASHVYTNYEDNSWLQVENDNGFSAGTYLWVLDQGTTPESGVWYVPGAVAGVTSYLNGSKWGDNNYAAKVLVHTEGIYYWDQIAYRRFSNGGHTWSDEQIVLKPTEYSYDQLSVCDPGVFKWGGYYYIGYTSVLYSTGVGNDVFVARSPNPTGPWEKWNGAGWTTGTDVQPVIKYDGNPDNFGAGEPSFVVLNDTIYMYYSWVDSNETSRLATAYANDANWPANLTLHGTVIDRSAAEVYGTDAIDVKYREDLGKFQAVHTAQRMSPDSFIALWESGDGINFTKIAEIRSGLEPYLHNCGWSGDAQGHIKSGVQQFIAYAYGSNWGNWKTFMHPINF